ncbi:MAG: BMP family ABC transporter substrate-binding protein [Anaerolineales bacterium]
MKKLSVVFTILAATALLLAACGPAATTAAPAPSTGTKISAGIVTDTGGIDDKSFNALAWKGVQEGITQLGISGKYLESHQQSDYDKNIQQFINEKADLIVTVGFLMGVNTATAAKANPNSKFLIIDYTYPDCSGTQVEGKDCGSKTDISNVRGTFFETDQAAFLAGYLAAGMTKTGTIGTFGGVNIPPVTIYMKGFQAGAMYYNQKHSTSVKVLGWDDVSQKGLFTGNFTSTDDGNSFAQQLVQEGADIVMPVAGGVGVGSAAYCRTSGKCLFIGVDQDWFVSDNADASVELVSVLKNVDTAVFDGIQDVQNGKFTGGTANLTLANGGVGFSSYHNFDSQVPASLKAEIDQVKADLISGKITVNGVLGEK